MTVCARCLEPLTCNMFGALVTTCPHCGHRQYPDPCPFCGGHADLLSEQAGAIIITRVHCSSCAASGPPVEGSEPHDGAKAVWEWNTRPPYGGS